MSATQRGGIGADVPEEVLPATENQPAQDRPAAHGHPHPTQEDGAKAKAQAADTRHIPAALDEAEKRLAHAEQRLAQMEGWAAQANQSFNVLAARVDVVRKQQESVGLRATALDFAIKAVATHKAGAGKPNIVGLAREFLAFLAESAPQMVEPVADGVDHGAEAPTTH